MYRTTSNDARRGSSSVQWRISKQVLREKDRGTVCYNPSNDSDRLASPDGVVQPSEVAVRREHVGGLARVRVWALARWVAWSVCPRKSDVENALAAGDRMAVARDAVRRGSCSYSPNLQCPRQTKEHKRAEAVP
jgi:hypothetical protein